VYGIKAGDFFFITESERRGGLLNLSIQIVPAAFMPFVLSNSNKYLISGEIVVHEYLVLRCG
jgi:hypothetical protein